MEDTSKRDADADLAVCDAATPGPWVAWGFKDNPLGVCHVEVHLMVASCRAAENGEGMVPIRANDMRFIAMAREALPHWVRRCVKAETENVRYRHNHQWWLYRIIARLFYQ